MKNENEKVLVVDTEKIRPLLSQTGLIVKSTDRIIEMINNHHYFADRGYAENCRDMVQIIPYVVIRNDDSIYLLQRLSKQTEKRLHGKLSIGIGGHINPESAECEDIIRHGLLKELHEEVCLKDIEKIKFVGIINDDATEVSMHHLGLLYELFTSSDVSVLETEKMTGKWIDFETCIELNDEMETWSQIALLHFRPEKQCDKTNSLNT